MEKSALSGTTVIDLSQHIAGPFCAKLLGDFGATVIKVEPPGKGDIAREMPPFLKEGSSPENSAVFLFLNSNKYGVTLDLEKPEGKKLLLRLLRKADVLIESFAPGEMERLLGFDYSTLEKRYPGLVVSSITPFGPDGPYAHFKAPHIVLQALGGWMYKLGDVKRFPLQAGEELGYYACGYVVASATAGALYLKNGTGMGQHIDLSLHEAHIATMLGHVHAYLYSTLSGTQQVAGLAKRTTNWFPGIFKAGDGRYIGLNILTEGHWEWMCEYTETVDLMEDPRLATSRDRRANGHEVQNRYEEFVKDKPAEEVFVGGMERRIPVAMVYAVEDMPGSPHYKERGFFVEVEHPAVGKVVQPGAPSILSATPWSLYRPAPLLGQHNKEIYARLLGLDKKELASLAKRDVI